MKSDLDLKPQKLNTRTRTVGPDLNHWYPVGWSDGLKPGQVKNQVLWEQEIAVYRGDNGDAYAVEDACLHKGVALHKGDVQGDELVCPYHGWRFDGQGRCVGIPYVDDSNRLPKKCLRRYPLKERYNLIWVFPGDPVLSESMSLPDVPEYDDPDWLIVEIPAHFNVHFSMVNENPLDVFHGHLHRDLQGWYNPVLVSMENDEDTVKAEYEVTFKNGWLPRILGLTRSKESEVKKRIGVGYYYPHCRNNMPGKSNYYFMRQPQGPMSTQSYSLLCLKIRLPVWLVSVVRKPLSRILWWFLIKPFLDQDIDVMESEQANFHRNPNRRHVEINPVIAAAQLLTVKKYDQYLQLQDTRLQKTSNNKVKT
ncbi:MAG: Rieske 2Fe-2S domain-containing protein [Gammaproteobacteria bacterium]|nr:Rieske 2Fe-2S domain-containing protein [Gammaproteobacteria bacterium]